MSGTLFFCVQKCGKGVKRCGEVNYENDLFRENGT